jgi:protein-S-isoprenylcysteine O-methyltransferase Ste14
MFGRALFAFLILPGIVAFLVPLLVIYPGASLDSFGTSGVALVATGSLLLLWCVRDFYVRGKGTLAPWAPPRNLVVVGLYRYSRNPMYLAVIMILTGWTLGFGSRALGIYTVAVALVFHLRVVFAEEPFLARRHGEAWLEYKKRVGRWLF